MPCLARGWGGRTGWRRRGGTCRAGLPGLRSFGAGLAALGSACRDAGLRLGWPTDGTPDCGCELAALRCSVGAVSPLLGQLYSRELAVGASALRDCQPRCSQVESTGVPCPESPEHTSKKAASRVKDTKARKRTWKMREILSTHDIGLLEAVLQLEVGP